MKLIIVSLDFPPSTIANARRPSLLAREMRELGHDVEVYTRDNPSKLLLNSSEQEQVSYKIHRLDDPLLNWNNKWGGFRIFKFVTARIWPDPQLFWVIKVAYKLRKRNEEATVVALINPVSMLMLRNLVPSKSFYFIYDFLESVSPFRKKVAFESFFHRLLTRPLSWLEKRTLKKCDRAIFTSSINCEAYIQQGLCSEKKAVYLPQYCDPNPYATGDIPIREKMVISYVGYFNRDRSPETFLRGLRDFLDQEPEVRGKIEVNCYGNGLGLHSRLLSELNLESSVKCCEPLDYEETLVTSAKSDVLLLVTSPQHHLFFPSKLTEYLAARRPILALVPLGSELNKVLKDHNKSGWTCLHDDVGAVTQSLKLAWEGHSNGSLRRLLPQCEAYETSRFSSTWNDLIHRSKP